MPLVSSGNLSIGTAAGGVGSNRSINLELNRAATATSSLNETALRTLAAIPSGSISMSNFYGKSSITFAVLPTRAAHYGMITNGATSAENNTTARRVNFVSNTTVTNASYVVIGTLGQSFVDSCGTYNYNPQSFFTVVYNSTNHTATSSNFYAKLSGVVTNGIQDIYGIDNITNNGDGILVDNQNRMYVAGIGQNLNANSNRLIWVAQFSSAGVFNWATAMSPGSTTGFNPASVSTAINRTTGDSYVAVYNSSTSSLLFKLNSSGTLQWRYRFAGTGIFPTSIAVDSDGNIYYTSCNTNNITYLHKLDSNGNTVSSVSITGLSATGATHAVMQINPFDNCIYIWIRQAGVATNAILKFNTSLSLQWQFNLTLPVNNFFAWSGGGTPGKQVLFDATGNIYFVTRWASSNYNHAFIKVNTSGNILWARQASGPTASEVMEMQDAKIAGDYIQFVGDRDANRGLQVHVTVPTDGTKTGTYNIPTGAGYSPSTLPFTWSSYTVSSAAGTRTIASATVPTRTAETTYNAASQTVTTRTGFSYPLRGNVTI